MLEILLKFRRVTSEGGSHFSDTIFLKLKKYLYLGKTLILFIDELNFLFKILF